MIATLIIAAVLSAAPSDVEAARADYQAHGSDPALRYLSLEAVPKGKRSQWAAVLSYQVPAASRAELVDRHAALRQAAAVVQARPESAIELDQALRIATVRVTR